MTTVAELREQLSKYPDDMLVITTPDEDQVYGAEDDESVEVTFVNIAKPPSKIHQMDYLIFADRSGAEYMKRENYTDIKKAVLIY